MTGAGQDSPLAAPAGFRAAAVSAGLKQGGALDVGLIVNDGPRYDAAAVFTTNRVQAAPVVWSRQVLADGRVDAVVLNSGGANACTGPPGFLDTHRTAETAAALLGRSPGDVAVCSTGLIGERLALDRLLAGVTAASHGLSPDGHDAVARAIMTTDTVPKQAHHLGAGWSVAGMAKGAGMLAPGLATMLVVLRTDAVVGAPALREALGRAASVTFDRVDSDGCMSTNDTVLLLASGASGVVPAAADVEAALTVVCGSLARALVADAEGARHDIEVLVRSAASVPDALEVARAVARSNLVKCAVFGNDPNWGRILAAVGTTQAAFSPDHLGVRINGVQVCRGGGLGEDRSQVDLTSREVRIEVDLDAGAESASIWTNDLTSDYVHENSAYST